MVANIRGYTPNFAFKLVNFDTPRWHTLEYANWNQLDAILIQAGIPQVRGEWLYSTQYLVGDRVFDGVTNVLYRCMVEHVSAATGTFEQDRLAHPTYWEVQVPGVPLFRGAWVANAVYSLGDIVYTDEYTYRLCSDPHTSSATFPPDIAYWQIIFDASAAVATAEQAATDASGYATAAGASASAAYSSEQSALAHKNAAAGSATSSADSASASASSATDSLNSANDSATSAAESAASATASAGYANDSAASAIEAANQAAALRGTSVTTNEISMGPKLFETQANKHFYTGTWLVFVNNNEPTNGMSGMVSGYSGTSLQVNITSTTGAGISSSWSIYVSGTEGLDGINGIDGQPGEDGDRGITWIGNWNAVTDYHVNDAVASAGSSYICVVDHINSMPPSVNWYLLAQGGTSVVVDDQIVPSYLDADTVPKKEAFADRIDVVKRAGDTMTGNLTISPTPGTNLKWGAAGIGGSLSNDSNGTPSVNLFCVGGTGLTFTGGAVPGSIIQADAQGGVAFLKVPANSTNVEATTVAILENTGRLLLGADPTSPMHAATKQYVDAADTANAGAITGLGNTKVNRSGDVMTGELTIDVTAVGGITSVLNLRKSPTGYNDIRGYNGSDAIWWIRVGDAQGSFTIDRFLNGVHQGSAFAISNVDGSLVLNGTTNIYGNLGTTGWIYTTKDIAADISIISNGGRIVSRNTATPGVQPVLGLHNGGLGYTFTMDASNRLVFGTAFNDGTLAGQIYSIAGDGLSLNAPLAVAGTINSTSNIAAAGWVTAGAAGHVDAVNNVYAHGATGLVNSVPAGSNAGVTSTVDGVRTHTTGTNASGYWVVYDMTAGGVARLHIEPGGAAQFYGSLYVATTLNVGSTLTANGVTSANDVMVYRAGAPTTGLVFYGNTGAKYTYWDGANMNFVGMPIMLPSDPTQPTHAATKQYVDAKVASGAFLPTTGGTLSGKLTAAGGVNTTIGYGGSAGSIEVMGAGGGADAMISFHRPGAFGVNFGLTTSNHMQYGGWSHGGAVFTLWSSAHFGYPVSSVRLAYAGALQSNMEASFPGSVITAAEGFSFPNQYPATYTSRYLQIYTNAWYTVGYA